MWFVYDFIWFYGDTDCMYPRGSTSVFGKAGEACLPQAINKRSGEVEDNYLNHSDWPDVLKKLVWDSEWTWALFCATLRLLCSLAHLISKSIPFSIQPLTKMNRWRVLLGGRSWLQLARVMHMDVRSILSQSNGNSRASSSQPASVSGMLILGLR